MPIMPEDVVGNHPVEALLIARVTEVRRDRRLRSNWSAQARIVRAVRGLLPRSSTLEFVANFRGTSCENPYAPVPVSGEIWVLYVGEEETVSYPWAVVRALDRRLPSEP